VITEAAKQSSQGWDSTGDWTEIEVRLRSSGLLNYDYLLLTPSWIDPCCLSWQGAWVLRPKSSDPSFVVHFIGGIFVGAAPQVTYRFFLERLAEK
jgi:hypothetical protein